MSDKMASGLFIMMYDENSIALCLKYGIYGFLMPPVFEPQPSSRSNYYGVLADYACACEGTHIFFFSKRKVTYGGQIKYNGNEHSSFYLNGNTSPLGRKTNAKLCWEGSPRYKHTDKEGVFLITNSDKNETEKAQPFILNFNIDSDIIGKQIDVDDLYFELGKYGYPLPSNSIQGLSICTLTPGETKIALNLCEKSDERFENAFFSENVKIDSNINFTPFDKNLVDINTTTDYINEAHMEFSLIANFDFIENIIGKKSDYVLCRQVPVCPFKPMNFDRADICLYDLNNPINDNTIPNTIIELKNKPASIKGYEQVVRYLKWLEQISKSDFRDINAFLVAPRFTRNMTYEKLNNANINLKYDNQIKLFSLNEQEFIKIK